MLGQNQQIQGGIEESRYANLEKRSGLQRAIQSTNDVISSSVPGLFSASAVALKLGNQGVGVITGALGTAGAFANSAISTHEKNKHSEDLEELASQRGIVINHNSLSRAAYANTVIQLFMGIGLAFVVLAFFGKIGSDTDSGNFEDIYFDSVGDGQKCSFDNPNCNLLEAGISFAVLLIISILSDTVTNARINYKKRSAENALLKDQTLENIIAEKSAEIEDVRINLNTAIDTARNQIGDAMNNLGSLEPIRTLLENCDNFKNFLKSKKLKYQIHSHYSDRLIEALDNIRNSIHENIMPLSEQVFEHVENSQVVDKAYAFLNEVTLSSNPGKLLMYQEFVTRIRNNLDGRAGEVVNNLIDLLAEVEEVIENTVSKDDSYQEYIEGRIRNTLELGADLNPLDFSETLVEAFNEQVENAAPPVLDI